MECREENAGRRAVFVNILDYFTWPKMTINKSNFICVAKANPNLFRVLIFAKRCIIFKYTRFDLSIVEITVNITVTLLSIKVCSWCVLRSPQLRSTVCVCACVCTFSLNVSPVKN